MAAIWDEKIKLKEDSEEHTLKELLQYYDEMLNNIFEKLDKKEEKVNEAIKLLHKRFKEHTHDKTGKTTIPYE